MVRGSGDDRARGRLEEQPAPEDETAWDAEYEKRMFAWAIDRVRDEFHESTWQAFWLTSVDGESPKDVAKSLRLSVGAVYVAKSRVLARLREEVKLAQDGEGEREP